MDETGSVSVETVGRHSADGRWWWDGGRWTAAWSSDGRWWFDGAQWTPAQRPQRRASLTRSEWIVTAVWGVLWVAGVVWAAMAVPPAQVTDSPSTPILATGLLLAGVTVVGALVTSGWLGTRRRWVQVLLFAAALTGALLAWYVAAMLAVPIPAGQPDTQDDAAGAGVVLLAVPTVLLVAVLCSVGAGVGALVSRLRRR